MDTQLFDETVKQDTPRVVVTMSKNAKGDDLFQWGIVGDGIPVLGMIGAVAALQSMIISKDLWCGYDGCPQMAAVIVWVYGEFLYFIHEDMITEACVGMLELIKNTLSDTHRARTAAAQQVILGPNGMPVNLRRK